jgi:hypothetical protein
MAGLPGRTGSHHRNDTVFERIAARFVVLADGPVICTHEVYYLIHNSGGQLQIPERHGVSGKLDTALDPMSR